jgi:hypothetical protein
MNNKKLLSEAKRNQLLAGIIKESDSRLPDGKWYAQTNTDTPEYGSHQKGTWMFINATDKEDAINQFQNSGEIDMSTITDVNPTSNIPETKPHPLFNMFRSLD